MADAPPAQTVQAQGKGDEAEVRALVQKAATTPAAPPPVDATVKDAAGSTTAASPAPSKPSSATPPLQAAVAPTPAPVGSAIPAPAPVAAAAPAPAPKAAAEPSKAERVADPKSATPSAAPSKPAPFTIQFGAYRSEANAEKLLADLTQRGYAAFILTKPDAHQQRLYLVRFGRFATREAAASKVEEITQKEKITAMVALSEVQ
jgi:cell division septation protein DedD